MAVAQPYVPRARTERMRLVGRVAMGNRQAAVAASLLALVTLVAVAAPVLAPHSPLQPVGVPFSPPGSNGFLLGSDSIGRDELSRVLYGIRESWFSALAVISSGVLAGGAVGLVAGATGGWVDSVLMRVTDLFLALPGPLLAIAVVSALGPGLLHTLTGIAVVWWPFYARIVRGEVRAMSARPHLDAARMAGVGPVRRALRHLAPGALPAVVVTASLDVGNLILTLAALSFLGLGAPAPAAELGAMSARNLPYLLQQWWPSAVPGIAILLLALVGNVAGDGVRTLWEDR